MAKANETETTETEADTVTTGAAKPDPTTAGIDHLRDTGTEPLRLWTVKGPKGISGTISGVFLQDTSEIVILQQLTSGKYVVFKKADV